MRVTLIDNPTYRHEQNAAFRRASDERAIRATRYLEALNKLNPPISKFRYYFNKLKDWFIR